MGLFFGLVLAIFIPDLPVPGKHVFELCQRSDRQSGCGSTFHEAGKHCIWTVIRSVPTTTGANVNLQIPPGHNEAASRVTVPVHLKVRTAVCPTTQGCMSEEDVHHTGD